MKRCESLITEMVWLRLNRNPLRPSRIDVPRFFRLGTWWQAWTHRTDERAAGVAECPRWKRDSERF